jgi:hypothetical protein
MLRFSKNKIFKEPKIVKENKKTYGNIQENK